MPAFSNKSINQLRTCAPDLQTLFNEVIKHYDCTVIEGHRDKIGQDKAFAEGKSKLQYPNGNHNAWPSNAVDVAPYPIDWKDSARFNHFAGFVLGVAEMLFTQGKITHKIRWGGDWDSDRNLSEEQFKDLVHFELALNA